MRRPRARDHQHDLAPGGAGVRAQALTRSGALVDDFSIAEGERMVRVLNAPSPGGHGVARHRRRNRRARDRLA